MKLYRATNNKTDSDTIPTGSCWTTELSTAEAYTDNPGFGGEHIVEAEIETANVADARGNDCRDLTEIANLLGVDLWDLKSYGYDSVFAVLENYRGAADTLREAGYVWVRYYDDYPENADCWCKL